MQVKHWGAFGALGVLLFAGALACRLSDATTFIAQATLTPTRTRTVRATFTLIPTATATPIPPSATPPPTATKSPTPRPIVRTPTPKPVVVAPPPAPPAPPPGPTYEYAANPAACTHAGNQYIKGRVYDSKNSDASGVSGLKVGLGGADGSNSWVPPIITEWDGFYTFTLSEGGGRDGSYYVWLMDGSGKRISDVGGPIVMKSVGPDVPGTCWSGSVDFWKR